MFGIKENMQSTTNISSRSYVPSAVGARCLTKAEIDAHFIDSKVARERLLDFVNEYFDQRECR